jgi:hypothetical protein
MKMKQLLMTTIAIFGLTIFTFGQTLPSYIPANGLVGWWPFNGNAQDESGNGNNGTLNSPSITTDRFGNAGAAYSFNGSTDYINTELTPQLSISSNSDISISYWCNFNSLNNQPQETFFLIDSLYSKGIASWYDPSNNKIVVNSSDFGASYNDVFAVNVTASNIWYNVFVSVNIPSNSIKLYINGVLQGTSNTTSLVISDFKYLHIGRHGISPNLWHMNGKIDDIGLWNRALTQEEITSLYLGSSLGINNVSQSNLFSVYPNPAQNVINVNTDANLVGSVFAIYDNTGKVVKTGKLNSTNTTIELNDLSGGIYTFSVGENKKQTFKVIKE